MQQLSAILLEQRDKWAVQRGRYMTLETIAALSDDALVGLPAVAIWPIRTIPEIVVVKASSYTTPRDTIEVRHETLRFDSLRPARWARPLGAAGRKKVVPPQFARVAMYR